MKTHFFISSLVFLFAQQKINQNENSSANHGGMKRTVVETIRPFNNNDVVVTSSYLVDADGYKYGGVYYIQNNSNYTYGVKWWFEGSSNVNFSPESSGRLILPGKTSGVFLTNVTSADRSKAWNSGIIRYNWDPAFNEVKTN